MSFRDDNGSGYGTGQNGFGGGGYNGGVGGGMGGGVGGNQGGGGARNGGYNSRTGLTTGTSFTGNKQKGPAGGISEQLAAAYAQAAAKKANFAGPKVAQPKVQTPLPYYKAPPPVTQPPLPPYEEVPPEVVPTPVGAAAPKPSFNKYAALDYYKSAYGPEGYAFAGTPGIGVRGMVRAADNYNRAQGYDHGISGGFNDKYGKK